MRLQKSWKICKLSKASHVLDLRPRNQLVDLLQIALQRPLGRHGMHPTVQVRIDIFFVGLSPVCPGIRGVGRPRRLIDLVGIPFGVEAVQKVVWNIERRQCVGGSELLLPFVVFFDPSNAPLVQVDACKQELPTDPRATHGSPKNIAK